MGLYDSVRVPCPMCGAVTVFQSKSGPCELLEFELEDAPAEVLLNVNRHAPYTCRDCGVQFEVKYQVQVFNARGVVVVDDAAVIDESDWYGRIPCEE